MFVDDRHGHAHHHNFGEGDGHTHGLVADSIKRSRDAMRTVALSLAVLGDRDPSTLCVHRERKCRPHLLDSPALVADGHHARADAYVSLGVVASAAVVALGVPIADPIIGLAITVVIGRITWQSWRTVHDDSADTP